MLAGVVVAALSVAGGVPAAGADGSGPGQGEVDVLAARITIQAGVIHRLTEQLDQARIRVDTASGRLVSMARQHDAALHRMDVDRALLLDQAVRAYMHGGAAPERSSMSAAGDVTLGQEYLRVASGDLTETGDQLRQLVTGLHDQQVQLQYAQQANVAAAAELQALRSRALGTAADEQVQLLSLQAQLDARRQAAAAVSAAITANPAPTRTTQGLPVNNGLVSVVEQAAGLPVAVPVVKPTPSPPPPPAGGGGNAPGVWLQLRVCESSDNYAEDSGNGFYGAYQFSLSTWVGLGFSGRPDQASPATQDSAARMLQAQAGWGQWPACAAALGLH